MNQLLFRILFLPLTALTTLVLVFLIAAVYLGWMHEALTETVVIEEGTAYGLTIGRSKDQVYSDLIKSIAVRKLVASGVGMENVPTSFSIVEPGAYEILMRIDFWRLDLSTRLPNVLKLFFHDGKLTKIKYFWSPGELP